VESPGSAGFSTTPHLSLDSILDSTGVLFSFWLSRDRSVRNAGKNKKQWQFFTAHRHGKQCRCVLLVLRRVDELHGHFLFSLGLVRPFGFDGEWDVCLIHIHNTINRNFSFDDVAIHRVDKEDLTVKVVPIDLGILRDGLLYKRQYWSPLLHPVSRALPILVGLIFCACAVGRVTR
jgi:hypothetical protein